MNVVQIEKGKTRWSMLDENTWNMLLGQQGQLSGPVDPEIIQLAENQGRSFFKGNPQDLYPDKLETYRQKMADKGWDVGQDEEELFEYAMHPSQYEAYKSGEAKQKFEEDLAIKKNKSSATTTISNSTFLPHTIDVEIKGEKYDF